MDDKKLKIHVDIADKPYGLIINRDEEEAVRKAAKEIRMCLIKYRTRFPQVAREDLLAMILLQFAQEKVLLMDKNDTGPFTEKIAQLTGELESYLKDK